MTDEIEKGRAKAVELIAKHGTAGDDAVRAAFDMGYMWALVVQANRTREVASAPAEKAAANAMTEVVALTAMSGMYGSVIGHGK